jgi:hypothetical protein
MLGSFLCFHWNCLICVYKITNIYKALPHNCMPNVYHCEACGRNYLIDVRWTSTQQTPAPNPYTFKSHSHVNHLTSHGHMHQRIRVVSIESLIQWYTVSYPWDRSPADRQTCITQSSAAAAALRPRRRRSLCMLASPVYEWDDIGLLFPPD